MKNLTLKVKLEEVNGIETVVTSYGLLKTAINQAPESGFTVDEIMVRIELMKKIDTHKKDFDFTGKKRDEIDFDKQVIVEFENAEFEKLKNIFSNCKWGAISSLIVDISNELKK